MSYEKGFAEFLDRYGTNQGWGNVTNTRIKYLREFKLNSKKTIPIEEIMERCHLEKHPYDMKPQEFIDAHQKMENAYIELCREKGKSKGHTNFITTNDLYRDYMEEVIAEGQLSHQEEEGVGTRRLTTFEEWLAEQTHITTEEKNAARSRKQDFVAYMKNNTKKKKERTIEGYVKHFEHIMNLYLKGGYDTYTRENRDAPVINQHPYFMTPHEFLSEYPKIKEEIDADNDKIEERLKKANKEGSRGHMDCRISNNHYRDYMEKMEGHLSDDEKENLKREIREAKEEARSHDNEPTLPPDQSGRTIDSKTERRAVNVRKHQDIYRNRQRRYWHDCCAVRGIKFYGDKLLFASHAMPAKDCDDNEAGIDDYLSQYNGFLLSPDLNEAFDKGFISFENNGNIIISKHFANHEALGITESMSVTHIDPQHKKYLEYHRKNVFEKFLKK